MRKLGFFAVDPGGINAIIPLIQNYKKEEVVVFCEGNSDLYECQGIEYDTVNNNITIEEVAELLEDNRVSLIITGTCANKKTEHVFWLAAKSLGIHSACIIDSWCNYGIRFSQKTIKDKNFGDDEIDVTPDMIFSIDEITTRGLIEAGINLISIEEVGHPYLSSLYRNNDTPSVMEDNVYKNTYKGKKIILFASDAIRLDYPNGVDYFGFDELTIFRAVLEAFIKISYEAVLIVRPHPKENIDEWKSIIRNIGNSNIILDMEKDKNIALDAADCVISMISIIMLEALIKGKNVLCTQIGLKLEENPCMLCQMGLLEPIVDSAVLCEKLNNVEKMKLNTIKVKLAESDAVKNIDEVIRSKGWLN